MLYEPWFPPKTREAAEVAAAEVEAVLDVLPALPSPTLEKADVELADVSRPTLNIDIPVALVVEEPREGCCRC